MRCIIDGEMVMEPSKEATRRVLDCLCGWADLAGEEGAPEADKTNELYEEFRAMSDTNPSLEQISAFLRSKVVSLLLIGV